MHNESEVLDELRSHMIATELANTSIVDIRQPIHKPELDHEVAADLLTDLGVELLLRMSA